MFATVMAIGRAFCVRAGEPDLDKLFSAASNHWIRQISYASSDLAHLGSSLVRGKREFAVDQIRRAPHEPKWVATAIRSSSIAARSGRIHATALNIPSSFGACRTTAASCLPVPARLARPPPSSSHVVGIP